MDKIEKKRLKEQRVVESMILLYCRKNHQYNSQNKDNHHQGMCDDCFQLLEYSQARSEHCPFMESKTFCANCRVHCYKPEMREKIRTVMRFSGPRMLFHHPGMAIWHLVCSKREKMKMDKGKENDVS